MTTNFWIHLIIFLTVFIITGVVISKRAKRKNEKPPDDDYEEFQAEVFEVEDLKRQAKLDRMKAREELKRVEALKRKAEDWEKVRFEIKASEKEMKNPYAILGVHENDSLESIKEVYQKLLQIYDSEINEGEDLSSKKQKIDQITKINYAYNWIRAHHIKNS